MQLKYAGECGIPIQSVIYYIYRDQVNNKYYLSQMRYPKRHLYEMDDSDEFMFLGHKNGMRHIIKETSNEEYDEECAEFIAQLKPVELVNNHVHAAYEKYSCDYIFYPANKIN